MNNFHNTSKRLKIKAFTPFFYKCGAFFADFCLTENAFKNYSIPAFAKSKASREKLNKQMANSTPTRAFFVRRFHTPKENRLAVILSMMACSGQPFAVGCVPFVAVSHPATRYRQTVRSLAIAQIIQQMELSAMIYKFQLLGTRLHVSTYAKSEAHARQFLNLTPQDAICFARIKGVRYA
ncbi:ash family protein [Avibacterium sp. 21-594]|uniref:ash family protein n=1 Tax=Avibacterium sp. 21-594 TaxID=2911535 RepID=UPI0022485907|nr:ash family protein [Avibacterium sp. 21-594]MCW9716538.1 ash family protein [Avibacterium sp. 21-594]